MTTGAPLQGAHPDHVVFKVHLWCRVHEESRYSL